MNAKTNKQNVETQSKEVKVIPEDINSMTTVSGKIRALSALGWSRGEIARATGKRYQHVRNVLTTQLKRAAV
jgi:hypothetical protein